MTIKVKVEKFLLSNFLWSHTPLLVTFYSVYEVKCDQKVEYGTLKSSIAKMSPLY